MFQRKVDGIRNVLAHQGGEQKGGIKMKGGVDCGNMEMEMIWILSREREISESCLLAKS